MVGGSLDAGITFIVLDAHPRGTPANIRIYLIFLETRTTCIRKTALCTNSASHSKNHKTLSL